MPTGERADARIPVTETTRDLIRDEKDDKESYDKFLRDLLDERTPRR